ncbi:hypothetical protein AB1Y20_008849 [Prymnesium parvum]|uniref:Uncharacterized protein n=1 Tax=Prymnesium parvum TaxID=97485 RepID=A0AB34IVR3_PRYPA
MTTDDADDSATPAAPSRVTSDIPTPSSYAEATSGRYASRWRDAMNEEIKRTLSESSTSYMSSGTKEPCRFRFPPIAFPVIQKRQ